MRQNYNYYIMITFLPNKVKIMSEMFKFEKKVLKSIHVSFLGSRCAMHGLHRQMLVGNTAHPVTAVA
jgi:hypothetical protein